MKKFFKSNSHEPLNVKDFTKFLHSKGVSNAAIIDMYNILIGLCELDYEACVTAMHQIKTLLNGKKVHRVKNEVVHIAICMCVGVALEAQEKSNND